MALVALSLLAVILMFLARNHWVKKVYFYVAAVLGIYVASIGVQMFCPVFFRRFSVGIARAMATVSLMVGMINVFV